MSAHHNLNGYQFPDVPSRTKALGIGMAEGVREYGHAVSNMYHDTDDGKMGSVVNKVTAGLGVALSPIVAPLNAVVAGAATVRSRNIAARSGGRFHGAEEGMFW